MPAMARRSSGSWRRCGLCPIRSPGGSAATSFAGRCRPGAARSALDAALWDLEAKTSRPGRRRYRRAAAASSPRDGIHLEPRHGGGDGGGSGSNRGGRSLAAQAEAGRPRRPRTDRGREKGGAGSAPDRRCQRVLVAGGLRGQHRRLSHRRRGARRATLSGRRRPPADRAAPSAADLRRRERPHGRRPRPPRRAIRRGEHQARQGRRADRSPRHGRGGQGDGLQADGGLHGRHVAGDGAGNACRPVG